MDRVRMLDVWQGLPVIKHPKVKCYPKFICITHSQQRKMAYKAGRASGKTNLGFLYSSKRAADGGLLAPRHFA